MKGLVLTLMLGTVGCAEVHERVRSCDEASRAPDGAPCEGFVACGCGPSLVCERGALRSRPIPVACSEIADAGVGDAVASLLDACAPDPSTGCRVSSECDESDGEVCLAPDEGGGICAFDSDCGCGNACIAGRCYATLGRCVVWPSPIEDRDQSESVVAIEHGAP